MCEIREQGPERIRVAHHLRVSSAHSHLFAFRSFTYRLDFENLKKESEFLAKDRRRRNERLNESKIMSGEAKVYSCIKNFHVKKETLFKSPRESLLVNSKKNICIFKYKS